MPGLCRLRLAEAALVLETGGTVAIIAGAWLDPIPGDEVAVTGAALAGDGGLTASTVSRIQQLKDRIAVLLGRGGARVAAPASETTGGLTNLGRTGTGVTLDGFQPGQAFSGVFDEATGTFPAVPSARPPLLATWVPRAGGHAVVNARLTQAIGTLAAGRAGFTAFLEADGTIGVEWLSRSVNGLAKPYVPEALRPDILRVIGLATGMAAFSR